MRINTALSCVNIGACLGMVSLLLGESVWTALSIGFAAFGAVAGFITFLERGKEGDR